MMKLQDKILGRAKLKRQTIFVDEWDTEIQIRELSGLERCEFFDRWREAVGDEIEPDLPEDAEEDAKPIRDMASKYRVMLDLVAKVAEEPGKDGEPLFTSDGIETLFREASYTPIERLFFEVMELSGMASSSMEEAGKNSQETPQGGGILS